MRALFLVEESPAQVAEPSGPAAVAEPSGQAAVAGQLSNADDNEDVTDESSSEQRYQLGLYLGGPARAVAESPTGEPELTASWHAVAGGSVTTVGEDSTDPVPTAQQIQEVA